MFQLITPFMYIRILLPFTMIVHLVRIFMTENAEENTNESLLDSKKGRIAMGIMLLIAIFGIYALANQDSTAYTIYSYFSLFLVLLLLLSYGNVVVKSIIRVPFDISTELLLKSLLYFSLYYIILSSTFQNILNFIPNLTNVILKESLISLSYISVHSINLFLILANSIALSYYVSFYFNRKLKNETIINSEIFQKILSLNYNNLIYLSARISIVYSVSITLLIFNYYDVISESGLAFYEFIATIFLLPLIFNEIRIFWEGNKERKDKKSADKEMEES